MTARSRPTSLVIPVLVIGAVLGLWAVFRLPVTEPDTSSNIPSGQGMIAGRMAAIDGSSPTDLVVCAQSTIDSTRICSEPAAAAVYELAVPPGQYLISSHRLNDSETQAFYTTRVTCTDPAGCSGQSIVVNVQAGQRLTGIDPIDWTIE